MKQIKMSFQILTLLLVFISCKKENNNEEVVMSSDDNSGSYFQRKLTNRALMDSLNERIIDHGDAKAYNEIQAIYNIAEGKRTSALYYALIMANKYNYNQAYKDVYEILNVVNADAKTKEMAEEYLKKYKD